MLIIDVVPDLTLQTKTLKKYLAEHQSINIRLVSLKNV